MSRKTNSTERTKEEDKLYQVETVLDKRINDKGEEEYEIKWVGYDETSWEPKRCLTLCQYSVDQFEKDYASRRRVLTGSQQSQPSGVPQLDLAPSTGLPQSGPTPSSKSLLPGPSPPRTKEEDKLYQIEAVLDKRINDEGEEEYEIKWVGYDETSWEPKRCLTLCQYSVDQFEKDYALRRRVLTGSQQSQPSGFSQPGPAPSSISPQPGPAPPLKFSQPGRAPPPGLSQPEPAKPSRPPQSEPAPPSKSSQLGSTLSPPLLDQTLPVLSAPPAPIRRCPLGRFQKVTCSEAVPCAPPSRPPQSEPAPPSKSSQLGSTLSPPLLDQTLPVLSAPPAPIRRCPLGRFQKVTCSEAVPCAPPSRPPQSEPAPPSKSSQLGSTLSPPLLAQTLPVLSALPAPIHRPPLNNCQKAICPKIVPCAPPSGPPQPGPAPPSGFSRAVRNRMKVFLPCKNRLKCQVQKRKNSFIKAHLKRTAKQPKSLPSTIFYKADSVFPTDKLKKIHTMFVGRVGHKTRIAHFLCIMQDKAQLILNSEIVKKHWPEILAKFYLRQLGSTLSPPLLDQTLPVLSAPPAPIRRCPLGRFQKITCSEAVPCAPPSRSRKPRPILPSGFSNRVRNRQKVWLPCKNRLKLQILKRKNYFIKAHLKRTAKQPGSLPSTIFRKADTVFPSDKLKKIHMMFVGRVGGKSRVAKLLCIMKNKEQLILTYDVVKKHWPEVLARFYLKRVHFHGSYPIRLHPLQT
ncbi:unnamed protein product [Caenorhabditis brenneri]